MKLPYKIAIYIFQSLAWIINILLPYIVKPPYLREYLPPFHIQHLSEQLFYILFFYINYYYFIPKLFYQKKLKEFIFSVIGSILFIVIINSAIFILLFGFEKPLIDCIQISKVIPSVIVFTLSTGLRSLLDWIELKQNTKTLEIEKQVAELAYLRSQINPHFMFNTLNNIVALIHINPYLAESSIIKLSKIMRGMISKGNIDKISLEEEIDLITSYIDLQKIRLTEDTILNYHVEGIMKGIRIEPLILINFIENAFKHGISNNKNEIFISITVENNQLYLKTQNSIAKGTKDDTSGIGLSNVKKRLDIIYQNRYTLDIKTDNELFLVNLKLNLE